MQLDDVCAADETESSVAKLHATKGTYVTSALSPPTATVNTFVKVRTFQGQLVVEPLAFDMDESALARAEDKVLER